MNIHDLLKPERGADESFEAYKVRRLAGNNYVKVRSRGHVIVPQGKKPYVNPIYTNPEEQQPCQWD